MAFDGLVTKAIACELNNLIGFKIDKIFQPTKNSIVLGLYGEKTKFALNVCIDSKFYRINLTTHPKPNPTTSPSFCMLLRKHLIGCKIKNITTNDLERVVIFELEAFGTFSEEKNKFLIVELMGKHSNIILTDKNYIIIDSLRHTNTSNNSYRNIFAKQKYVPPKSDKASFMEVKNFDEFCKIIEPDLHTSSLEEAVANNFIGMSKSHIDFLVHDDFGDGGKNHHLYNLLKKIIAEAECCNLSLDLNKDGKDYGLTLTRPTTPFALNFFIDDFYFELETNDDFTSYRNSILKLILDILKKYNKRLLHIDDKLNECTNMDTYKLYGELLTANLYQFNNKHLSCADVINYYDGNNNITIPLDKKHTVNDNAKLYFKKYNKLKNALEVVKKQKEETVNELNYIESVVYELENASTLDEIKLIFEEISENIIFKDKLNKNNRKQIKKKKETKTQFNPLKYIVDGYTVLIGRNNKENDWLTTKHASPFDLWFHTEDIHGSHVILKTNGNTNIEDEVLIKCAELAAAHSKAKFSSNVPVDYTQIKYVKKPNGAKPGMVVYTHNKTLYIT